MLHAQLKIQMKDALKARQTTRLTTLRGILSAITNELVATKRKPSEVLDDAGVLSVIKRAVKQRKDSIDQFEKGGREDLVNKEKEELGILEAYLPMAATREDIERTVTTVLTDFESPDVTQVGILIGRVMKELSGNADGALVKEVLMQHLS